MIQKDARKKLRRPITGLYRPLGLQEFEVPRFKDRRHRKVVRKVSVLSGRSGSWVFVGVGYGTYLVSPFWRLSHVRNISVRCVDVLRLRQLLFLSPHNYGTHVARVRCPLIVCTNHSALHIQFRQLRMRKAFCNCYSKTNQM